MESLTNLTLGDQEPTADGKTKQATYIINGIEITVDADQSKTPATSAILTKEIRRGLKDKDRIDLIKQIQAKQQQPFHAITISKTDPEKMTNTHSVAKLLEEHKRNLEKYDLLGPYTIVLPVANAFDVTSKDFGRLQTDISGVPLQFELHKDYLRMTVEQVEASSRWYATCVPEDQLLRQDLVWSGAYYEKNVEESLYNDVHSLWMEHPIESRGGPLFLKLLLDQVTTTSEANLKALVFIIETYKIKVSCPGEDINKVVAIFKSLFNNIAALRKGELPPDSARNLLKVFQTTSVDIFNNMFTQLEQQLAAIDIQITINPANLNLLKATGAIVLLNDMPTIKYILTYAQLAYRNLVQSGDWDSVLQKPAGKSAFVAQPGTFSPPSTSGGQTPATFAKGTCFNCGGDHHLRFCKEPRDNDRINHNRAQHPNGTRTTNGQSAKAPWKWRKPEEHEHGKRVIDGVPNSWNPNAGKSGRWEADETPSDGQPADMTMQAQLAAAQLTAFKANQKIQALTAATSTLPTQISSGQSISNDTNISSIQDAATLVLDENGDSTMRKYQAHLLISKLQTFADKL